MSRVIPTKPGWWWVSICGDPPIAKFVHMDEDGDLFIIRGDDEEQPLDSIGSHWVWLAPVPSAEAVQALVSAAQRVVDADDEARDALKNLGVHDVGGESLTEDLRNAIAGLTGGQPGMSYLV